MGYAQRFPSHSRHSCIKLLQVDAFIFLGVFGPGWGHSAAHPAAAAWVFYASSLVLVLVIIGVITHPHVVQVCAARALTEIVLQLDPLQTLVDGFVQWLHTVAPDSYR
jgi:hypothetical protein